MCDVLYQKLCVYVHSMWLVCTHTNAWCMCVHARESECMDVQYVYIVYIYDDAVIK